MQIEYSPGLTVQLTTAEQFALNFMLGLIGQGHGCRVVRCTVPAIKFLRMAHGLSLVDSRAVMLAYEQQALAQVNSGRQD